MPKKFKECTRKYRNYELPALMEAARLVRDMKMTIYSASKQTGVPWSTLKDFLTRNEVSDDNNKQQVAKLGRPFALTANLEVKLFDYIIKMQELGFGLTVNMVRKTAYALAKHAGRENFFGGENTEIASKWWWAHYKKRFNMSLRVPENLAAYRASMANPEIIQDYFSKLEDLLNMTGVKDMPDRLWNCDETGLSYVVKPKKIVTSVGKRYIYKRAYADRGESQTLLGCACANGTWIPPMIIFKGIRWNDSLMNDCLPNTMVKLSPKGWINSELFLEWFRFFIESIPPARPVILFMDSHASHINPEVISLAKDNQIYLFTYPAHTSHLLQPLDVGVYKSLKSHWQQRMDEYMREHSEKPNRTNFHTILNPAFILSFCKENIQNAFRKSGIYPFNKNAVAKEAIAPSSYTANRDGTKDVSIPAVERDPEVNNLLPVPQATIPTATGIIRKKRDFRAKCLNLEPKPTSAQPPASSGVSSSSKKKKSSKRIKLDDDWECGVCGGSYSGDHKQKNGAQWVQCSYCLVPYHVNCQPSDSKEDIFMCDMCAANDSDESEED